MGIITPTVLTEVCSEEQIRMCTETLSKPKCYLVIFSRNRYFFKKTVKKRTNIIRAEVGGGQPGPST